MNIELPDIKVKCCECGTTATGEEINSDVFRFHGPDGEIIQLPQQGISLEQAHELGSMSLYCECCQEDREEQ
jgi:hypothetical protein